jgi:hypothetical protein
MQFFAVAEALARLEAFLALRTLHADLEAQLRGLQVRGGEVEPIARPRLYRIAHTGIARRFLARAPPIELGRLC